jgi:hypothetical protein
MPHSREPLGALFFWDDEPHVTGYMTIGNQQYELAGVRKSDIRTDITKATPRNRPVQTEMFDDAIAGTNPQDQQVG